MEKKQKTPKEKRRNMERRKEKSRDAARCRRSKETDIFTDLYSMLPLWKNESVSHLDKASIIRIAISYLKIRTIIKSMPVIKTENINKVEICGADSLFLNALEGFLLVTNTDGDIIFISENVNRYLGLSQVDLLGQSIYEISHPCDHAEITEMLSTKEANVQKSYFLRMKCTLTNKGRNVNIKSASYKVIQYTGRVMESKAPSFEFLKREQSGSDDESGDSLELEDVQSPQKKTPSLPSFNFVAVGEPISHPANIEIPLGQNTFLTKHSLDMKFNYADERIIDFFGYNPDELIDKSVFDYHHAEDSISLRNCFKNLFQKGQSQTEKYRFLAAGGGYAWVLTQATVIYSNSHKPQSVVCVNFVISEVENENEIYSLCQMKECSTSSAIAAEPANSRIDDKVVSNEVRDAYMLEDSPRQLLEKLTIDTASAENVVFQELETGSNAAPYRMGVGNLSEDITIDLSSLEEKKSRILRNIQLLSVNDFLTSCSSSPSSSSLSPSGSVVSESSPLSHNWLMTANDENLSPTEHKPYVGEEFKPAKIDGPYTEKAPPKSRSNSDSTNPERVFSTAKIFSSSSVETPKPATVNVFVPFTEDMNKCFLGFSDDNTELTLLEEDHEDLTHLAPTAGGVCVPLDENPIEYVLPTFDDFLSDCKLLSNDSYLAASSNAFFSYREDIAPSPSPISPMLPQNEDCSIPPISNVDSPLNKSSADTFLDFERLIEPADEIDDLSSKDSLLPLTLDTDPILPFEPNDFMWESPSSPDDSPWSSISNSPPSNCPTSPRLGQNSSLAKLLAPDSMCNYDSGAIDVDGKGISSNHNRQAINKRNICQTETSTQMNRSYSNNGFNSLTTAYQTGSRPVINITDGNERRCNSISMSRMAVNSAIIPVNRNQQCSDQQQLKRDINNLNEDNRSGSDIPDSVVAIGNKRSSSENWGRTNPLCKRSKPTATPKTLGISSTCSPSVARNTTKMIQLSAAMSEAVVAAKHTNSSVLMNLLVSGCDLGAGYEKDRCKDDLQCDQATDEDMRIIEDALRTGNFRSMSVETWARIRKKILDILGLNNTKIDPFCELTDHDCNVNAPSSGELLQGSDLLNALEYSQPVDV